MKPHTVVERIKLLRLEVIIGMGTGWGRDSPRWSLCFDPCVCARGVSQEPATSMKPNKKHCCSEHPTHFTHLLRKKRAEGPGANQRSPRSVLSHCPLLATHQGRFLRWLESEDLPGGQRAPRCLRKVSSGRQTHVLLLAASFQVTTFQLGLRDIVFFSAGPPGKHGASGTAVGA